MISSFAKKHYTSAHQHLFEAALDRLLQKTVPLLGGPELRKFLVDKILAVFDSFTVACSLLKPGQMLWVAIDKDTRADSAKVIYRPVVLTLVAAQEIDELIIGSISPPKQLPKTTARILKEAHTQNALLSMRDLALIFKRCPRGMSGIRKQYETQTGEMLPTPATLQDMGSGITHKALILRKILVEKKDMATVRNETNHGQRAIDSYLKCYRRVAMLLDDKKKTMYIAQVTGLSPYLILQYEQIYNETNHSIR